MTLTLDVDIQELLRLPREELIERAKAKAQLEILVSKRECEESLVEFV